MSLMCISVSFKHSIVFNKWQICRILWIISSISVTTMKKQLLQIQKASIKIQQKKKLMNLYLFKRETIINICFIISPLFFYLFHSIIKIQLFSSFSTHDLEIYNAFNLFLKAYIVINPIQNFDHILSQLSILDKIIVKALIFHLQYMYFTLSFLTSYYKSNENKM